MSKCCYTLTVWLGILKYWVIPNSISEIMFCQLTRKYHSSVWQGMWFLFQSEMETNISSRYRIVTIWFQSLTFFRKVCESILRTRCCQIVKGAWIRSEGGKLLLDSLKITVAHTFILLSPRFHPSLTAPAVHAGVWGHSWGESLQVVLSKSWIKLSS